MRPFRPLIWFSGTAEGKRKRSAPRLTSSLMILMTGSVILRAAPASQTGVPSDTDVTTGASGLVGEGGGAVVTGAAIIAFVHGLMIEVIILLGGPGFHQKEIVMAGLTIHTHVFTVVVMGKEYRL